MRHINPSSILFCLLALLLGCKAEKKAPQPTLARVQGEQILLGTNSAAWAHFAFEHVTVRTGIVLRMTGRLVWNENLTARIFSPFAGRIKLTPVEVGQEVAQGQTLALVESPDFGQAQADARRALSDYQLAQQSLERVKGLYNQGNNIARKDLQAAEADYSRAVSEKERTAARIALYGGSPDAIDQQFLLRSPLAGILVEKNIYPGQEIRADLMLANAPQLFAPQFVVTDPSHLWLLIDAAERDLPHLKPGAPLQVQTSAYPDKSFAGRLLLVSDTLDPGTRTVRLRGIVENPARLLKAEMYVTVDLQVSQDPLLRISKRAVVLKGQDTYVFLQTEPGLLTRRRVSIGSEQEGQVIIHAGLESGQRVVTSGSILLEQLFESSVEGL